MFVGVSVGPVALAVVWLGGPVGAVTAEHADVNLRLVVAFVVQIMLSTPSTLTAVVTAFAFPVFGLATVLSSPASPNSSTVASPPCSSSPKVSV